MLRVSHCIAGAAFVAVMLLASQVVAQGVPIIIGPSGPTARSRQQAPRSEVPRGIFKSVPGTGTPAFGPSYTPGYSPGYSYGYSYRYPYQTYYRSPYRSVPGTGIPYYTPYTPYYPPVYPTWRLGITGIEWPGVGVRISTMEPGSPAERMGIEMTDVIVQLNGRPIRTMYDLQSAVAASGGYARVLVLDNRTNSYMWHNGSL